MCIRDRLSVAPGEAADHRAESAGGEREPDRRRAAVAGDGPVSYTHLTLPTSDLV